MESRSNISEAASLIRSARYLTAFTGAGISVESGIPPFRDPVGLGAGGVAHSGAGTDPDGFRL